MFEQNETPRPSRLKHFLLVLVGLLVAIGVIAACVWGLVSGVFNGSSEETTVSETNQATEDAPSAPVPTPPAPTSTPTASASPTADATKAKMSSLQEQAEKLAQQAKDAPLLPGSPGDVVDKPVTPNNEKPEVILSGDEWFGGDGVNVCKGVAGSTVTKCGDELHVGGIKENWWQCVELLQRHYQYLGWHDGVFPGVERALDIYEAAEDMGMEVQPNGQITTLSAGDMIVHKSAGYDSVDQGGGHVSEINYIDGNIVHVIEQNGNASGRATYIVVDGTLVRIDMRDGKLSDAANTVLGVVHSPKNTANPPHELRKSFDEKEYKAYLDLVKKSEG